MPELAEVEVVRRNLVDWWEGRAASEVRLLDEDLPKESAPEQFVDALRRVVTEIRRRGKYLICAFADASSVVFHFRMTGKIIRCASPDVDYARAGWRVDETGWLVFKDQRRLGEARVFEAGEIDEYAPLQRMGPEPEDVTLQHLRDHCSDRRMLKTALLDQSIVAGVGNIAVSELFWRLQFAPGVKCGELTDEQMQALIEEMPRYFNEIIDFSMADEIRYIEEAGAASEKSPFQVYGREGEECPRCFDTIEKIRVGGRSSYFCRRCQR